MAQVIVHWGERIGDTLEWRFSWANLPDSEIYFPLDCRDQVKVGFAIAGIPGLSQIDATGLYNWSLVPDTRRHLYLPVVYQ